MGSSSPVRNLPEGEAVSEEVATKDAELCFERGSIRQHQLHPAAPLQDSRCYIYRAVGRRVSTGLAAIEHPDTRSCLLLIHKSVDEAELI